MSKIKNGELEQYGAEPFEQQQFGTAGVEGVKELHISISQQFTHLVSWECATSCTGNVIHRHHATLLTVILTHLLDRINMLAPDI